MGRVRSRLGGQAVSERLQLLHASHNFHAPLVSLIIICHAGLNVLLIFVPIAWSVKASGYKEHVLQFIRECPSIFPNS
jgi:hypothetical protein